MAVGPAHWRTMPVAKRRAAPAPGSDAAGEKRAKVSAGLSARDLARQLRDGGAEHANNAVKLLRFLRVSGGALGPGGAGVEDAVRAVAALRRFFLGAISEGTLQVTRTRGEVEVEGDEGTREAVGVYEEWVKKQYRAFKHALLAALSTENVDDAVGLAALNAAMDLAGGERRNELNNDLFQDVVCCMACCPDLGDALLREFNAQYLQPYADVAYYTASDLQRLCARKVSGASSKGQDDTSSAAGGGNFAESLLHACDMDTFTNNAFRLLVNLPPLHVTLAGAALGPAAGGEDSDSAEEAGGPLVEVFAQRDAKAAPSVFERKSQQKAWSDCWLAFLRLPQTAEIYTLLLGRMEKHVLPNLTNPLLLADYLTQAYDAGGSGDVMNKLQALSALHVLVVRHGLEYPHFYPKLYRLLSAAVLYSKHRTRFLELVALFLKTPYLPASMAAAFAKKFARLALFGPPQAGQYAAAMAHNLIRRHPECVTLVHRGSLVPEAVDPSKLFPRGGDGEEGGEEEDGNGAGTARAAQGQPGTAAPRTHVETWADLTSSLVESDPYDEEEEDPEKCRALDSSLWELDALRHHYFYLVKRGVGMLDRPSLSDRKKGLDADVDGIAGSSHASLLEHEATCKIKNTALAVFRAHDRLTLFGGDVLGAW